MERKTFFVDVLLPLPLPGLFTYRIPHDYPKTLDFGIRVIVPFGRSKLYSGIIIKVHHDVPAQLTTKYIIDTIDDTPVITPKQYRFWQWLSEYYMCTLGEVMNVSLPSALKIASETNIILHPEYNGDLTSLNEKEIAIIECLSSRHTMTLEEVSGTVSIKKVIPVIKTLVEKGIVLTDEEVRDPYKSKSEAYISLADPYTRQEDFYELIASLEKSKRNAGQVDLLLSFFMQLQEKTSHDRPDLTTPISKKEFLHKSNFSPSRLNSLVEKGILEIKEVKVSRLAEYGAEVSAESIRLSPPQEKAMDSVKEQWKDFPAVLLNGVTGSGKTEIYIKLIDQVISEGKQVLYLLPEIALTSQIVNRLRKYFGDRVGVYHSRFNEYERVEIWNRVLHHEPGKKGKYQLILGARSALLLPYQNLGLVIVDEEHDSSYKQYDPAPRYHARDGALVLSRIHQGYTLLGTATPSLESYYNALHHKYGYVELKERYAESRLPEVWVVDIVESLRQKKMTGHFSQFLLDHIGEALRKDEQVILFQNRRGFSLRLFCNTCQSMPMCRHCDVTLTYHKKSNVLKCHYCGYAIEVPDQCPECGSKDIEMKGFGTEKVEESLQEVFPGAKIARMDLDTTRSKSSYQRIIQDFEHHKTDILVGTQMVTKGLDFDRVSVVGILNADNLISYPDFRSFERAFQVMAQVSGRAGRKDIPGKVIIQSYNPSHPALQYVVANDYEAMYRNQIAERKQFHYPPYCRLIKLTLKHRDEVFLNEAARVLAETLYRIFPSRVLGPEYPLVSRIQNLYLKDIWIKLDKNEILESRKLVLKDIITDFQADKKYKSVRIVINVDA